MGARISASLEMHRPGGASTRRLDKIGLSALREPDVHVSLERPEAGVVLFGHIDSLEKYARELGLPPRSSAAMVYAAAHALYGSATDTILSGSYCAVLVDRDGGLRIARSPWDAPPVYLWADEGRWVASPHVRVLQAAGAPLKPAPGRLRDALAFDFHETDDTSLYPGIRRLPLGTSAWIEDGQLRYEWQYDAGAVCISPIEDGEAVRRASELLDEAVREALGDTRKPVISLSAGLDSSLVAASAARQASPGNIPSLTIRPDPEWRDLYPGSCDDEWPAVCRFAEMHSNLEARQIEGEPGEFDALAREVFATSRIFTPGLANIGMFAPLWAQARREGHDAILTADLGNQSFSASGTWALAADAKSLAWVRLARNLAGYRAREGTGKAIGRLIVSPLLPERFKAAVRHARGRREDLLHASMLCSDALRRHAADRPADGSAWRQGAQFMNRAQRARYDHAVCDRGAADILLALREIHHIRHRDVTAYRPLIEFCLSLPDEQFLRRGEDRYLARRMARGLMPEPQRRQSAMARHNVDWHSRLDRRIPGIRLYARSMRQHETLRQLIDFDRLEQRLQEGFDQDSDYAATLSGWFGVTSAILAGRYVGAIEGRNDF